MNLADADRLLNSLRRCALAAQSHEISTLSTILLPRAPSIEPLIPLDDKDRAAAFLKTKNPAINIAWDYIVRETSNICEYGSDWVDTQTIKHFPVLLQPPSKHIKSFILDGLSSLFMRYQIKEEDACLCNCGSPLVLRINAQTERGLALYDAIMDAKSDYLISSWLSKFPKSIDENEIKIKLLNVNFARDGICPDDVVSFLERHQLIAKSGDFLITDADYRAKFSTMFTEDSSFWHKLLTVLISYHLYIHRSNSAARAIIYSKPKSGHKLTPLKTVK